MELTSKNVNDVFMDCLFCDGEIENGVPIGGEFIKAEGVVTKVGFHPGRIKLREEDIVSLLSLLPENFNMSKGGGWSFLQMPSDVNGNQWGEQRNADQLLCLGIASGKMKILLPREMWNVLPGGVPYVAIL